MSEPDKCSFCDRDAEAKWPDAVDDPDARPTCFGHCGKAEDGQHVPDPASLDVLTTYSEAGRVLADLNCKCCGQSGSISLTYEELSQQVNWL